MIETLGAKIRQNVWKSNRPTSPPTPAHESRAPRACAQCSGRQCYVHTRRVMWGRDPTVTIGRYTVCVVRIVCVSCVCVCVYILMISICVFHGSQASDQFCCVHPSLLQERLHFLIRLCSFPVDLTFSPEPRQKKPLCSIKLTDNWIVRIELRFPLSIVVNFSSTIFWW